MTAASIDVDLSGFGLRFEGLTPALGAELAREWEPYVRTRVESPALVIRVEDDDRTMKPGRFMEAALEIVTAPDDVSFRSDEGELASDLHTARAVARLARGSDGRRFWGLVNLTCAAIGWRLLARGGGALHAAGVIIAERAYLLVGPSGCGKTTWARTAAEAGLPVISDDCVLIDSDGGRPVALGSPFRSKDFPSPGPGRWPVAALLIPDWAADPSLAPTMNLMLEARLAANLLFSTQAPESRSLAGDAVASIAASTPSRKLSFRPDGSWIPLVKGLAAGR